MGERSGQGMHPEAAVSELLSLLTRCFTTQAKPDKTHTFAASGLVGCLSGCAGSTPPLMLHGGTSLGFAECSCGRYWKNISLSFPFSTPPPLQFL